MYVRIRRDNDTQTLNGSITNADIPSTWNGPPVVIYTHRGYGESKCLKDLAIL